MQELLAEIIRRCGAGEHVVLCVLVGTRGSTPQKRGAKMLVLQDGGTLGTLGGGCVEAEVRQRAVSLLAAAQTSLLDFSLDHDYGWDDGLICGGAMEVLLRTVTPQTVADLQRLSASLAASEPATLEFSYESRGQPERYTEPLGPPERLVIAGAGHVGQSLAKLARLLDFQLTVIDDRPDYLSPERFPNTTRIVEPIEPALRQLSIDTNTFIVIVTRGHRNDGHALGAVINSPARYIGLIGSKRKVKTIFDDLLASGVPMEQLLRVHAPIGLDLGAVSPAEIAVSIAAELIAVRRHCTKSLAAMRIPPDELQRWLTRPR